MMEMVNLFPIPLGVFKLPDIGSEQADFLLKQKFRSNNFNRTSVDNYILENEILKPLKSQLEYCILEYASETMAPQDQTKIAITQSWVNYSKKGESHHQHYHQNSTISGVFYIETTDDDKIIFYNSYIRPNGWSALGIGDAKKPTAYNAEDLWVPAVKSSLLLFPSTVYHSVGEITEEKRERVSLSFNTFFKGPIGDKVRLTYLEV